MGAKGKREAKKRRKGKGRMGERENWYGTLYLVLCTSFFGVFSTLGTITDAKRKNKVQRTKVKAQSACILLGIFSSQLTLRRTRAPL